MPGQAILAGQTLQLVLLELERERADRHVDQLRGARLHAAGGDQRLGHATAFELAQLVGDRAECSLGVDTNVGRNRSGRRRGGTDRTAESLGEIERLGGAIPPPPAAEPVAAPPAGATASFQPIAEELRDLERRRMAEALAAAGGVKTRAAQLIDMPIRTFAMKAKQYKL